MSTATASRRLAADIGGTFTDVILVDGGGRLRARKVLTTPGEYRSAIMTGLDALSEEAGEPPAGMARFTHGTTIATNAIIAKEGGRVALLTTEGFIDVLEIARIRTPALYDIRWEKPAPLVPANRRLGVRERIGADGTIVAPLADEEVERVVRLVRDHEPDAIAVCLINSFANPEHELVLGRALAGDSDSAHVSLSSDLLPEMGEYERTSTTVVNSYLRPVVSQYLRDLEGALEERGIDCPLLVMQSNGGTMTLEAASTAPIHIVESGPAGGVIACAAWAERLGLSDAITLDMGGTTAKASLIRDAVPTVAQELELRPGITVPSRLFGGGGYVVRSPAIDIAEVGAGGGSIAYVDVGGALQVGPASAGSVPGPVCYGLGGTEPTVTDADVVLGFLAPDQLLDSDMPIDLEAARDAIEEKIAQPLGITVEHAASGIHTIANARMIRAIKHVTTERGLDLRGMTMFAFGGSGPVHAAAMAADLGLARVIVPPLPGLFSSFGLLLAKITSHLVAPVRATVQPGLMERIRPAVDELRARAVEGFERDGVPIEGVRFEVSLSLRYVGQRYALEVGLDDRGDEGAAIAALVGGFHEQHQESYGRHEPGHLVEVVAVRLRGTVDEDGIDIGDAWSAIDEDASTNGADGRSTASRAVFFSPDAGSVETPVIGRSELGTEPVQGPLIVEDYGSTIVVPPDARAYADELQDVVIEIAGGTGA